MIEWSPSGGRRDRSGLVKPETFNFLGYPYLGRSRHGKVLLKRNPGREANAGSKIRR